MKKHRQIHHWKRTRTDPEDAPLHTFVFKYRSRGFLNTYNELNVDILDADEIIPSQQRTEERIASSDVENNDTTDPYEKIRRLEVVILLRLL